MPAGTLGYAVVAIALTIWAAGGSSEPVDPDGDTEARVASVT